VLLHNLQDISEEQYSTVFFALLVLTAIISFIASVITKPEIMDRFICWENWASLKVILRPDKLLSLSKVRNS